MRGNTVREKIYKAAVIPMLFALIAVHYRKRRAKYSPLNSSGQVSSQRDTRDRVVNARVSVQRVNPNDPNRKQQVNVAVDHGGNIPRKTDAELRQDAEALHKVLENKFGPKAKQWYTVATAQDANGNLYYTVNNGSTDIDLRNAAEAMGYNRIHGQDTLRPDKTHAEQVFNNALAERDKANQNGYGHLEPYRSLPVDPVRLSPDKAPCEDNRAPSDPKNQNCRTDSNGRVVGWP